MVFSSEWSAEPSEGEARASRPVRQYVVFALLGLAVIGVVGWLYSLAVSLTGTLTEYNETPRLIAEPALEEAIADALSGDEAVPLASLTDFEWTTVSWFEAYYTQEGVEAALGLSDTSIGDGVDATAGLWVFCQSGDIVAMFELEGPYVNDGTGTYSVAVQVDPVGLDGLEPRTTPLYGGTVVPECTSG